MLKDQFYSILLKRELKEWQNEKHGIIQKLGMTGFDGGGWPRIASREVPTSINQHKNQVPIALPTLLFLSLPNSKGKHIAFS